MSYVVQTFYNYIGDRAITELRCDWNGVFPAAVTPFTPEGAVDEGSLRLLIDLFISEGVQGLVAVGSTGEWFSLNDEERLRVFRIFHEQVAGRVPVVGGTSAIGTRETVALTEAAKDIGLDGCMVLPPPYAMPNRSEVVLHLHEVADVGLPVMLYNNPPRTGINIDSALLADLVDHPNIVAFKDSTKDLYQMSESIYAVRDRLACFAGLEPYGGSCFSRGAVGIVSTISNICAPDVVAYCEHLMAGRFEKAAHHQEVIDRLYHLLTKSGAANYVFVKEAMALLGRPGGSPRKPYRSVAEASRERIRVGLKCIELTDQEQEREMH